ncbi:MAG TPA: hypothetical protein VLW55_09205 [Burkholderiaceae bacterium]|nr:hypothetical protein [Burkholderiaceae bacterium]
MNAPVRRLLVVPVALLAFDSAAQTRPADPAAALYAERCAKCHEKRRLEDTAPGL